MKEYYLDNSSTTRINEEVLDVMCEIYKNQYGNPSSLHSLGVRTEKIILSAKKNIAEFISCDKSEIVFTSGGTESNNIVISSFLKAANKNQNIIISQFEHPSIYESAFQNENVEIRVVDVDEDGYIDMFDFEKKVDGNSILASIMYVNNELGTVQDIEKLLTIAKKINPKICFHTDAVQAYGKIPINVKKLGVDFMTMSSHKISGPQGVGALYVRKNSTINPLMFGGRQENAIRPGTENVAGIAGFGKATKILKNNSNEYIARLENVKIDFQNKFVTEIDDIRVNSKENGAPHIFNVTVHGIRAEILLHYLEMKKIFISTGTTCSSKAKKENRVLSAIGLNDSEIQSTIRISFGRDNLLEDNDYLVGEFKNIINEIRKI